MDRRLTASTDVVRFRIDAARCDGQGVCVLVAPELFALDWYGLSYVRPGADQLAAADPEVRCPAAVSAGCRAARPGSSCHCSATVPRLWPPTRTAAAGMPERTAPWPEPARVLEVGDVRREGRRRTRVRPGRSHITARITTSRDHVTETR